MTTSKKPVAAKPRHLGTPDVEKKFLDAEEKVPIFLPKRASKRGEGDAQTAVNISVNGVQYSIEIGKAMLVPKTVKEEYEKIAAVRDLY